MADIDYNILHIQKESLNILYAEDSPVDFVVYKTTIEKALKTSHEVRIVNTNSLETTLSILNMEEFDLVITDLNLIDSRGSETFTNIKKHCEEQTPIIVLTSLNDTRTRNQCIKAGAAEYFVKSVSDKNLISSILAFSLDQEKMKKSVTSFKNTKIKA